jgi:hypothetical protein
MGHSEMLLAVAGLEELGLKKRVARLASGDWRAFPANERVGLHLARKLTRTPWEVAKADLDALTAHVGLEQAIDSVWYIGWCNYMTRVADAFQIPLERDNVFRPPSEQKKPKTTRKELAPE